MNLRDMKRSDWTRILQKEQIIEDFSCEGKEGKISLLKILKCTEAMSKCINAENVTLVDENYYWLQLAFNYDHSWYTAMFDDEGSFLQLYIDITGGNDTDRDNPVFRDMYLDYVYFRKDLYELDRDELEEAFRTNRISRQEYADSIGEGNRIKKLFAEKHEEIEGFFVQQFDILKQKLEQNA